MPRSDLVCCCWHHARPLQVCCFMHMPVPYLQASPPLHQLLEAWKPRSNLWVPVFGAGTVLHRSRSFSSQPGLSFSVGWIWVGMPACCVARVYRVAIAVKKV